MRLLCRPPTSILALAGILHLATAIKENPEDITTTPSFGSSIPTTTSIPSLDCFNTIINPTTTCTPSSHGGTTLNCTPSPQTTTIVCKPNKNCFKNSHNEDVCVPRNDRVAPAGIIFAVGVAVVITIIAVALFVQRIRQKRKRRQDLDDRVRGVHMGMTGSQKVEVTFVQRPRGDRDEEFLMHDIPPAYTEADRKRGVPSVVLNGGVLPEYEEDDRRRLTRI